MNTVQNRTWKAALDVVFPVRCLGCGRPGRFICSTCVEDLPTLDDPYCEICASPGVSGVCSWCREKSPAVDWIRAPYLYVGSSPIHQAITRLKYGGIRALASELASLLAPYLDVRRSEFDVVVPVASHPSRLRSRGYNQAALIAEELATMVERPVQVDALRRVRNAPSQLSTASREDRWTNVQEGFACDVDSSGETILLIDDLVTTGSTASACAAALKKSGAAKVLALSVARAP